MLFHDISFDANGAFTGKGILQSYQSEHSLLCISINDEHVVAMGNSVGQILIYDLRSKSVAHIIEHGTSPILDVAFQTPQWSVNAAAKDVEAREKIVNEHKNQLAKKDSQKTFETPKVDARIETKPMEVQVKSIAGIKKPTAMDMFSPVNPNPNKTKVDLRKSTLKVSSHNIVSRKIDSKKCIGRHISYYAWFHHKWC